MTLLRGRFSVTNLNKKTPTIELRMTNQSLYNMIKRKKIRATVFIDETLRHVIIRENSHGVFFHLSHSGSTYLVTINPLSLKRFLPPDFYSKMPINKANIMKLNDKTMEVNINEYMVQC